MLQNCQMHFKNRAAIAARFLKYVWPFWDILYERVKIILCSVLANIPEWNCRQKSNRSRRYYNFCYVL